MTPKYGFVALLDALGTRTASIQEATEYLKAVTEIEKDIKFSLRATLNESKIDPEIFKKLSIRFFGDTILITYEITKREAEEEYFDRITFVLRLFICKALTMGLLFRGSLSVGDYVDSDTVVLGPAVTDAAAWYERLDMIGVILTPHTTFVAKQMRVTYVPMASQSDAWDMMGILDKHPLSGGGVSPIELYALNWPYCADVYNDDDFAKCEKWFYEVFRKFKVPAGVESKYHNTEKFFHRGYAMAKEYEARRRLSEKPQKKKSGQKG